MPCQDCAKPTISHRPVTSLASRIAASLASPPVDSSITRGRSGTSPASASARSTTGADSIDENRWSSRADRLAHRGDDLGMRMAEDRAHLAGGEVQHPAARRVVQERALGAHRHERHEVAAIAQQMPPRAAPEGSGLVGDRVHRHFAIDFMFIFMPFGPTMSPGCMSAGHGPVHFASCVIDESAWPIIGGSKCD